jgi:molybdenum cofactor cytidylyltransferase
VIAAVVLAAGRGERFGGDKVLAPLHGQPIVRHVVQRLHAAGLSPVIVVGGASVAALRAALADAPAQVVENAAWSDGLSSSLRAGVAAVPEECSALVIALGDQPLLDVAVVRALVDTWRGSNAAAVVPEYADGRGNPVLFDATLRRRLLSLSGDAGARALLEGMGDRVVRVPVSAPAPRDVDTVDDLRALEG